MDGEITCDTSWENATCMNQVAVELKLTAFHETSLILVVATTAGTVSFLTYHVLYTQIARVASMSDLGRWLFMAWLKT